MKKFFEMKPVTELKIKACLHIKHKLTEWEIKYLEHIQFLVKITIKQKMQIDGIYTERVKGIFTGYEVHESWADVHLKD